MNRGKAIIGVTVLVDVIGMGIVIPVLPVFLHSFVSSPFWVEMFFAIYAFFGFFAAPVLGALSDKYGRRLILVLSIFGTAIGWFVFALGSKSLICLVIGRIIDGITSGNISTAQSYMIDSSKDAKERTSNLGFIGALFGIGFILGPAIGGALSKISLLTPFWVTAVIASLNAISAYFFLPESPAIKDHLRKISLNPFKEIWKAFHHNSKVKMLLWAWVFYTLCFGIMQATFSLFGYLSFGFSPTINGMMMSMVGLIIAINQGFLLKKLWLNNFSEKWLAIFAVMSLGMAYVLMTFHSVYILILALILSSLGQSLGRVVNNSAIAHLTPPTEIGQIMGVIQSIMFMSAIIAPIIGGIALEYNMVLPWIISLALMVIVSIMQQIHYAKQKNEEHVVPPAEYV